MGRLLPTQEQEGGRGSSIPAALTDAVERLHSSENAVSARVAAIIVSKRRRKSGKRRGCEGMCFSLPTPDDPFNERHGKKSKVDEPNDDTDAAAAAVVKD